MIRGELRRRRRRREKEKEREREREKFIKWRLCDGRWTWKAS